MIKSFLNKINLSRNQIRNKMSEVIKQDTQRNTEIKCRVGSDEEFQKKIEIAKKLTSNNGTILRQDDVFFNCNSGRLKLRYIEVRSQFNPPKKNLISFISGFQSTISSV